MRQTWYADGLHQQAEQEKAWRTVQENSLCYPRVTRWFMKCQTLLPLKNSGLHICLVCLFQLSQWHTVPVSPGVILWTLWQMNGGSFPPFQEKTQNCEWGIRRGAEGKSPCCVTAARTSHLTPQHGRAVLTVQRQTKLSFRGQISVLTASGWKCFNNPLFS